MSIRFLSSCPTCSGQSSSPRRSTSLWASA